MIFPIINVIKANTSHSGEAEVREAITAENSVIDSKYQIKAILTSALAIKLSRFFNEGFNLISLGSDAHNFGWNSCRD